MVAEKIDSFIQKITIMEIEMIGLAKDYGNNFLKYNVSLTVEKLKEANAILQNLDKERLKEMP
jgi:hypothetical protein